jgi:hypothetical protein
MLFQVYGDPNFPNIEISNRPVCEIFILLIAGIEEEIFLWLWHTILKY